MSFFFINCNSQQEIKSISTKQLKVLLEKENIQLLDIRTPKEIKQGFIETALFVDFYDANFHTKAIEQLNKNKPVYVYCRSGGRSAKATKVLQEKGYKIFNVLGGYNQWKKEN